MTAEELCILVQYANKASGQWVRIPVIVIFVDTGCEYSFQSVIKPLRMIWQCFHQLRLKVSPPDQPISSPEYHGEQQPCQQMP